MSENSKSLKPGWKVWRFDQIATNVNVRIDNPSESGMAHYVGLEHLDPDSLRIRRWGSPSDVEAGKLFFKTGDIIFAKRRAYQRKLGVAEFDGICSAHAMVLRAKPEVVLPEFLPFFMQSDLFMNRAVEISVGSLSPTINWKTMAMQEFALPPMEEQKRISKVSNALDFAAEEYLSARQAAETTRAAMLGHDISVNWPKAKIVDVADVMTGKTPPTSNLDCWGEQVDFATPADLKFDTGELSRTARKISEIGAGYSRVVPAKATLVVCIGSTIGKVAMTANRTAFNQQINAVVCRSIDADYFYALSTTIGAELAKRSGTTAVPIINKGEFEKIEIPVPPIEKQIEIGLRYKAMTASIQAIERRLKKVVSLRSELFWQVFEWEV